MNKLLVGKSPEFIEDFKRRRRLANKKYYSNPEAREKKRKYKKAYDLKNREKILSYAKELRARPDTKKRMKKWREENKAYIKKYNDNYKKNPLNKIRKRLQDKSYRKNNYEKCYLMNQKWRERNPEKVNEYRKKYNKSEKGKIYITRQNHLRMAYKRMLDTDFSLENIRKIINRDKVCVYCSCNENLQLDHITPLAKGGSCYWNNLVLACGRCNQSKSDRDVFEWCKMRNIRVPEVILEKFCTKK